MQLKFDLINLISLREVPVDRISSILCAIQLKIQRGVCSSNGEMSSGLSGNVSKSLFSVSNLNIHWVSTGSLPTPSTESQWVANENVVEYYEIPRIHMLCFHDTEPANSSWWSRVIHTNWFRSAANLHVDLCVCSENGKWFSDSLHYQRPMESIELQSGTANLPLQKDWLHGKALRKGINVSIKNSFRRHTLKVYPDI